ncbi:retrotransposon protein, putative, ty1-copia subclass [Tanacetum coccineum]
MLVTMQRKKDFHSPTGKERPHMEVPIVRSRGKVDYDLDSTYSDPKDACVYCKHKVGIGSVSARSNLKDLQDGTGLGYRVLGYALETAAYILNLVPTKKVSKTPFEMWKVKRPLGHIKIWGCEVFVRREAQDKLEARSEKYLFVGYPEESFGYLFYRPKDNVVFVAQRGTTNSRVSKPYQDPQFYYGFHIKEDKISDSTLIDLNEPANYKEAMACPEAAKWKEAMKSEIQSMLVAKGYTQTHEIDYEETFSPVAKIKSFRIMLAIAAFHDYEIWQMDVNTAFLNEKLTNDVFMAQPEGFENAKYPKRVCKLQKAIYGLKQASRSWNLCFHEKVTQFGFFRSEDEFCIYIKVSGSVVVFLNSKKGNQPLHHGIKISSDLCSKTDDEQDKMSRVPYASAIGSIMYAMMCTRPDVSFALSMVSQHQQNPGEGHWTAVKNILKYLRNTKDRFLVYGGEKELRVTGYCDASWQTDKDDSKSQSGWVFLLNGGAVTWKSSKQDTVADSTCESEYIAACEASKEAIWMKNFIGDLGVVPTVQDPIEIFCDNESAVALTKEPKDHGKSKHIDRKYHFVRSKVAEGHVIVKDVRSEDNSADPFTKALAKSKHDEHAWSIGLKDKIKF